MQGIKKETRILAIDDGYFEKFKQKTCLVIGVIFRGAEFIDGLISFRVKIDGDDATRKLIKAVNKSKHKGQLSLIMLNGIAVGGFNVFDIKKLNKYTGLPVIVVSRKKPRIELIKESLKMMGKIKEIKAINNAGKPKAFILGNKKIYFQHCGINEEKAIEVFKITIKRGNIPEPIRVAHIIASGLTLGENRGRP